MKLYIPFNMIIDTDAGVVRVAEKMHNIPEYPVNKLKSFLLNRTDINPLPEYAKLRKVEIPDYAYNSIITVGYPSVLALSFITDILAFVINTYKLGYSNDINITIGCDNPQEIEHLKKVLSNLEFSLNITLNSKLDLNDFDYIFTKYINEFYVDDIVNNKKLTAKRLYISDHKLNTLSDENGNKIIDIQYHIPLESNGIVLNLISIYNKKRK